MYIIYIGFENISNSVPYHDSDPWNSLTFFQSIGAYHHGVLTSRNGCLSHHLVACFGDVLFVWNLGGPQVYFSCYPSLFHMFHH